MESQPNQIPAEDDPLVGMMDTSFIQDMTPEMLEMFTATLGTSGQVQRPGEDPNVLGGYFNDNGPQNLNRNTQAYEPGAQFSMLSRMNTAQRLAIQGRLQALGFMGNRDYTPGLVDRATVDAMADVLTIANRTGITYTAVFDQQQTAIDAGQSLAGQGSTNGRVYERPNTASLENRVFNTFETGLGRPPTQAEMRMFTNQLMSGYDSGIADQQAAVAAAETGRADVIMEGSDPAAEFEKTFRQKYAGTKERNEQQEDTTVAQNVAIGQAANIERAAGL